MKLNEVIEWLVANRYLINKKGKYLLTTTFQKAAVRTEKIAVLPVAEKAKTVAHLKTKADWTKAYIQFISLCDIDAYQYTRNGKYALNKYSEEGMKAFKNAITKEDINPEFLILAVRLYYKSSADYKKAIGNYMASGEWRTDYFKLLNSKNKEELNEHIEEQHGGPGSNFRLG